MTTSTADTAAPPHDGWVMVGMAVAATSAATASFTGLRGLAEAAGWPDRLAWLLPVTIDAYAMTAARVWLAGTTPGRRARRFARANAVGAIAASIVGNAAYHMLSVGLLSVSWPIVVLVGAVPAAVLGLTAHLHALRTLDRDRPDGTATGRNGAGFGPEDTTGSRTRARTTDATEKRAESGTANGTEDGIEDRTGAKTRGRGPDGAQDSTEAGTRTRTLPRTRRRPRARTEDALMDAARTADARYRAAHDGRPITRDALRTALRIAGPKATDLRRRLATEQAEQATQTEQAAQTQQAVQAEPDGHAPDGTEPTPESSEPTDRKEAHTTR